MTDAARTAIKSSLASGHVLYISTISLAEILYLDEKNRLPTGTFTKVLNEIGRPDSGLVEAAVHSSRIEAMTRISRDLVPEMPDRIIAGTALHLGVPLVTADHQIRSTSLPTIW